MSVWCVCENQNVAARLVIARRWWLEILPNHHYGRFTCEDQIVNDATCGMRTSAIFVEFMVGFAFLRSKRWILVELPFRGKHPQPAELLSPISLVLARTTRHVWRFSWIHLYANCYDASVLSLRSHSRRRGPNDKMRRRRRWRLLAGPLRRKSAWRTDGWDVHVPEHTEEFIAALRVL